jgi:hypothetical protein
MSKISGPAFAKAFGSHAGNPASVRGAIAPVTDLLYSHFQKTQDEKDAGAVFPFGFSRTCEENEVHSGWAPERIESKSESMKLRWENVLGNERS